MPTLPGPPAKHRAPHARRTLAAAIGIAILSGLLAVIPWEVPAAAAGALPSGFTDTPVFTGLDMPTAVAFSPDGKVYVAEKGGAIYVYPSVASDDGRLFKDLSDRVFNYWDRGLLGLTVDPRLGDGTGHDFVYALYAKDAPPGAEPKVWDDYCPDPPGGETDGCVVAGTLSRIRVNPNGTAGTEQILIDDEWCQQFTSHSVGHLAFGRDGYLYVSGGEGASWANADWGQFGGSDDRSPTPVNPCGDPPGGRGVENPFPQGRGGALRSQSPRRPAGEPRLLSGSLLRVDPDTGAGVPGNPMYSAASPSSNASRIMAYGMRNPFRFTPRPGTDEMWVGDVGQSTYEEINRVQVSSLGSTALNFGWPCYEGPNRLSGYRNLDMCQQLYADTVRPATNPLIKYEHDEPWNGSDTCESEEGSSIAGLAFYDGDRYPASYSDALFVADSSRSCIWVMSRGSDGLPDPATARTFLDDSGNPFPVDLATDPVSGDLFYVNIVRGSVNRISYQSSNRAPVAAATAAPRSGTAPLTVKLDASASTDPDGDALTYSWDVDGNGTFGDATGPSPTVTYAEGGAFAARVMVTDPGGLWSTSDPVTITVASPGPVNTAPPTITGTPRVGAELRVDVGTWTGTGTITYGRQWQRCPTSDSCADVAGATGASYTAQLDDAGSTIRVRVSASDSAGTTRATSAAVGPVATGSNAPPVPVIDAPSTSTEWRAGDTLSFSGRASDAEDGTVPAARLSWSIVIGHCPAACHEHPLMSRSGVASGTFAAPEHQAPSFIELRLTATDAAGATATTTRRIQPETADLTFRTSPAGLQLTVGPEEAEASPFTQSWVANSQVQLSAPAVQTVGGTTYDFVAWSDGGDATHVVKATANTTYTATYAPRPKGPGGGAFVGITPHRALDTRRPGEGPCVSGPGGRQVIVAPAPGVPADAAAVALNVTVTGPRSSGYLTVHPTGTARPTSSNLNYSSGQTVPNLVTTKVGTGGRVTLYASGGCPEVAVDVTGYYRAGAPAPGGFVGITPRRVLDTRDALQQPCVSGGGRQVVVAPRGDAGIPADAAAVALNVTVTGARSQGYLTVHPAGTSRPTSSNLNYYAGQTVPNHVTTKVGAGGEIAIYASGGCPHVIVDVAGYYTGGTPGPGGFVAISPHRAVDTRDAADAPCIAGRRKVRVAPEGGVPADASAVVLNVTVQGPGAPGYLTVYPAGVRRPTASNLNYTTGQVVPNAVISRVTDGQLEVYSSGGCPHVIVDVAGYHLPSPDS